MEENKITSREDKETAEVAEAIFNEEGDSGAVSDEQAAEIEEEENFRLAAEKLGSTMAQICREYPEFTILSAIGKAELEDEDTIGLQGLPFVVGNAHDVPFLIGRLLLDELPALVQNHMDDLVPEGANRAERRRAERNLATVQREVSLLFFTNVANMFCANIGSDEMIRGLRTAIMTVTDAFLSNKPQY